MPRYFTMCIEFSAKDQVPLETWTTARVLPILAQERILMFQYKELAPVAAGDDVLVCARALFFIFLNP